MSLSGKNGGIKKACESDFRFEPPPEAPVFCPTEEEWKDPLGFIRSVRGEAEAWGICKIRPPPAWQPPFALDVDRFAFTPRIQRLNELEAKTRVKLNFLDSIAKFWELQGSTLKIPVLERRALDLCALHRLVGEEGGHEEVTAGRRWSRVATQLGFSHGAGALLRGHYMRILYPYDVFQLNKPVPLKSEGIDEEVDEKPSTSVGMRRRQRDSDHADVKPEVENAELRRLQFFGPGPKMAGFVPSPPDPFDPLSKYACLTCGSGGAEESMLLCDGCDDSYHTFCLTPPLTAIPAGDWRCPRCVALEVSKPQEAYGFEQARREYTLQQFGEMADEFKCSYFNMPVHRVSTSAVESEFWRVVSSIDEDVTVEYGADLHTMDHGSGFPTRSIAGMHPVDQAYADSPWNLNNLPTLPGSVLAHINADISGMKVPWMYVGMCFAAFCWHNEDHWSYSINYLHWGEPKTWYGVSGRNAEAFERTMRAAAPELFQSQPDLLHQLVTIMNPNILTAAGVPVCRTDQNCGEFVVTFPRAYHAGFNQGYNFAEAVNFAPADWLSMGRECVAHYSNLRRFCVFAHDELVVKMAANHAELDLNEAAAAYQDMRTMVIAEQSLRKALLKWGVTSSKRQEFEALPDDARQCHSCKTTCFLSAVTCSCCPGRLVCLRHYDRLCTCPPAAHTLRFRHLPDELPPLLAALAAASGAWEAWMRKVRIALKPSSPQRLTLAELEALADEARRRRFPTCDLFKALDAQIKQAGKLVGITRKVTGDSPVLRLSSDELHELHKQFDNLPCAALPEADELAVLVRESDNAALLTPKQEPMDAEDGDAWLARANAALNSTRVGRREAALELVTAADLLPAHSEEVADVLAALRTALDRAENVERRANKALAEDAAPMDIKELRALLQEAQQVPTSAACLDKLRSTYRAGRAFSREATLAMRGGELLPYYDAVQRLVSRGAALPLRPQALPELRKRLAAARRWRLDAAKVFLPQPADPEQLMAAIAPKTVFGVAAMSLPTPAPGPPTVGGVTLGGNGAGGCAVRDAFREAANVELRLIRKLANPSSLSATSNVCSCRMPRGRGQVTRCLVCSDSFHHGCLEPALMQRAWFVCAGCCRTLRPTLKPVLRLLVALRPLTVRLPEGDALQSLADRALGWQDRARNLLSSAPLLRALQDSLIEHTSDPKLKDLTAASLRDTGTVASIAQILDSSATTQLGLLKGGNLSTARDLLREGSLLEVTLDEYRVLARLTRPPEVAKRPRSPRSPARAAKGRRRTSNVVYTAASSDSEEMIASEVLAPEEAAAATGDEEFCAAEDCVGPLVDWVQCDSRCKRWFHLACVGMADVVIKEADVFFCPACRLGDPLQIPDGENGEGVDSSPSSPSGPAEL